MSIFAKMKTGALALCAGPGLVPGLRPGLGLCLGLCLGLGLSPGGAKLAAEAMLPVLEDQPPGAWDAVGRVNVKGYNTRGMCSGVLVAPDWVLTAAHCLYRGNWQRVALEDLHFVAGWDRGRAVEDRAVAEAVMHPKAWRGGRVDTARDVALLRLEAPMGIAPLPLLGLDLPEPPYAIVAYQASRPHLVGGRFDCDAGLQKRSQIRTTCGVEPGSSGGPMLVRDGESWAVVGVVSARSGGWTLVARAMDWVAETVGRSAAR